MTKDFYTEFTADKQKEAQGKDFYSEFKADKDKELSLAARSAMIPNASISPDLATKQYQLSRQTSIPIPAIRAKENEIKKMTEINSIDYDYLAQNFPKVAMQLADPSKAGAIKDDLDKLSYFEKIVGETKKEFTSNLEGAKTTNLRFKAMVDEALGQDTLSNEEKNQLYFYSQEQAKRAEKDYELGLFKSDTTELLAKIPSYTIGQLPNIAQSVIGGAMGAGAGFVGSIFNPAGAAAGGAIGYYLSNSKRITVDSYDEFKNFVDEDGNKLDPKAAAGAALLSGGIGGALELFPFAKGLQALGSVKKLFTKETAETLAKTKAGQEVLKNIAVMMAAEGGTEALQEATQIISGEIAKASSDQNFNAFGVKKGEEIGIEEAVKFLGSKENLDRIKEAGIAGALGGAGFGAFASGLNYTAQVYQKNQKRKEEQKKIDDLVKNTAESKTYQRDPELFKEVNEQTLGQENVYLPIDEIKTYFQKNPQDLEAFYDIAPEAREQVKDALETGGNIILKGTTAVDVFNQEQFKGLQRYASLSPESLSDLQAQDEFLVNAVPSIIADEQNRVIKTREDRIKKDIEGQLFNLGMPARDVKQVSALINAFYDTQLKRVGDAEAQKMVNNLLGNLQIKKDVFIDDIGEMVKKAKAYRAPKAQKPLLNYLKKKGGVKADSTLAGELKAMGITPKSAPGLFKKEGGVGDIDNIPASEFRSDFPKMQFEEEGDYVNRQNLLDLIGREMAGQDVVGLKTEEQIAIEDFLQGLEQEGIDINLSDEEIKKIISERREQGKAYYQPQETNLNEIAKLLNIEFGKSPSGINVFNGKIKDISMNPKDFSRSEYDGQDNAIKRIGAKNIDLSQPIEATLFKDGKIVVSDGHHRLLAANQLNKNLKVNLSLRNVPPDILLRLPEIANFVSKNQIYFQTQDQTKTEAFRKWAGGKNVDIVESDEINYYDFKKDTPVVLKVFHGTTHDFNEFDATRGNKESQFGAVNYFTSSYNDAEGNYKGEGPDLTQRIQLRKERLDQELEDFAGNQDSIQELMDNYGITKKQAQQVIDGDFEDVSMAIASRELRGDSDKVLELYVKLKNPFVVGEDSQWIDIVDNQEIENRAIERVAENNDVSEEEIRNNLDEYQDQIDEIRWEIEEEVGNPLVDAINNVASRNGVDASNLAQQVYELGSEARAADIEKLMRESEDFIYAEDQENGGLIGFDLLSQVIEEMGYDSIILKNADQRFSNMNVEPGTAHIHIFNSGKTNIKSVENKGTFDPNNPNIFLQKDGLKPKGQTQFIGNKSIITLFETADRSTLLHELGHTFLQVQQQISQIENVSEEFKNDWKVLEDWLEIKDGNITTEAHEKFARGFEAYLMEGKAPSIELRDAFRRFKEWLVRIYKSVLNLDVKLNNNIRDVFDRMLATKEAIDLQKNSPLYRADNQVMDLLNAAEKKDYLKITQDAGYKAEEKLMKKALAQKARENKKFYKEAKAQIKAETRAEMQKNPTYRVINFLRNGELWGAEEFVEPYKINKESLSQYPQFKIPSDLISEEGVDVDIIADEFGFKSAGEMLNSITKITPFEKALRNSVNQEMLFRYGDMLYDGTIEEEADQALQNEAQAKKILYELNAAARKTTSYIDRKAAYKDKAKEIFATKKVADATNSNQYYLLEVKAAREAGKALAKKDYVKAVEEKKKQLLNHYLYSESLQFKKNLNSSLKSYKRLTKKPVKGKVNIDEDYRLRIVNLLADFGLARKPLNYIKTDINSLEEWKKKQSDSGVLGLIPFPEIAEFQNTPVRNLSVNQYRALDDSIENLAYVGKEIKMVEIEGKKIELNALADEIKASIEKNLKLKKNIRGTLTAKEEIIEGFDQFTTNLIKAKNIALKLDGEEVLGTFYQAFIAPIAKSEIKRNEMIEEAVKKLNDIYSRHFKKGLPQKRTYFESVNAEYNTESLLAFALNWGTEKGRKRIRDGFGYTDEQVYSLLSKLNKNELSYVQEIWDYIGSYWDNIESLERKLVGFAPQKEMATPFTIRSADGQDVRMTGGYYPLHYTEKSNLKDVKNLAGWVNPRINFEKSYVMKRTDYKVDKEINLTLIPAIEHISDVVNDLAMKEAAWNSDKILNNPKVRNAIVDHAGVASYKELRTWLEDLFGAPANTAGAFGKIVNNIRAGTTISVMGLKASTALIQISGYPQSIVKIGYKPMLKGLLKFLGNGNPFAINKAANFALNKSKILKSRSKSFHQDIYDTIRIMQGKNKISSAFAKTYFYPIAKMQMMVDIPTWYGAYYKGLDKFKGDDAKAVDYADLMVAQAQGSGLMQDLSGFERGSVGGLRKSEFVKIFTAFMTYMNAKLNLAAESYRRTNFRKPKDVARFTSDMLLLYAIEPLIGAFILGKMPDFEDDDEDKFAAYTFKLMAENFFSQFPISREITASIKGFETTPSGLSGTTTIGRGIKEINKGLTDEEGVNISEVLEGLNNISGIIFKYPSGQIDVAIEAFQEAQEGEDVAPIDYLIRPQK